jgi:hypothetical protein
MTRQQLLDLAERVEREEPSRELDSAVWRAIGSPPFVGELNYTTSRDDAASLMPETVQEVTVRNYPTGTYVRATTKSGKPVYSEMLSRGGPCEAQARTAAALRARAQEAKDE